jgi:hypothetical protein
MSLASISGIWQPRVRMPSAMESILERRNVYHSKVDSEGGIVLSAEFRIRHQIKEGDTVGSVDDGQGIYIGPLDSIDG